MKRLLPINTRVLVLPIENSAKDKTPAGIIIPDTVQQEKDSVRGIVTAIGPKVTEVEEKELVYFSQYAGNALNVAGTDHILLEEREIFLVEKEVPDVIDKKAKVAKA